MSRVTVYSKPHCIQCDMTTRALTDQGVDYQTIDLTTDPKALEHVMELGYKSAPVIITATDHWSGFQPDKIKNL